VWSSILPVYLLQRAEAPRTSRRFLSLPSQRENAHARWWGRTRWFLCPGSYLQSPPHSRPAWITLTSGSLPNSSRWHCLQTLSTWELKSGSQAGYSFPYTTSAPASLPIDAILPASSIIASRWILRCMVLITTESMSVFRTPRLVDVTIMPRDISTSTTPDGMAFKASISL